MAICQPTYVTGFYKNRFNRTESNYEMKQADPERFIVNGAFDPRDGEAGLDYLDELSEKYKIKGVKLYTAEWRGDSKGYKLSDPSMLKYFERCEELGIKNIHVHKGPTILPLNRDAFDVADVDDAATSFPDLNFIVEHVGLPRLDDFCWIATQEPNVYAGLAVASALIHTRKRYFAEIMTELLYWLGSDRILFGSDYAIWQPKWIVEQFMDLELSDDLAAEANHTLTLEIKKKIMAENCARLYDIDISEQCRRLGLTSVAEPVGKDLGVGVS